MKYGTFNYLCVDENVLMVKKDAREDDPNSGFYALPGGKLNNDEKRILNLDGRIRGAIREGKEETGLTLINPKFIGAILFDNSEKIFDNWKNPKDFFVYVFSAQKYTGTLKGTEEGTPIWVPKKEILSLPMNAGDKKMYEWIFDGRNFAGVIYHKGKELDLENTFVDFY